MSGIFGLIHLDGAPVDERQLDAMAAAMSHWGPDGVRRWTSGPAGLGQCLLRNTPEAVHERVPAEVDGGRLAFTAEARIDNRDELCDCFGIPLEERPTTADSALILLAHERWGEDCAHHLIGDWSFAVWYPRERRLFLARDHHGNTALYHCRDGERFAFASDRKALLALPGRRALNEVFLAQVLVRWEAFHGPDTIYQGLQRLPPAHTLAVTPDASYSRRYWRLEDTSEVRLGSDDEYDEAFLSVFREAVRCRLRSHGPIASMLSGGLDSGSGTAIAARDLSASDRTLLALTSVPLYDATSFVEPWKTADEWLLAEATARHAGNIDHVAVRSEQITPIGGLARMIETHQELLLGVGNYHWIAAIFDEARRRGVGTLLEGQMGNGTISWLGAPPASFPDGLRARLRPLAPAWLLRRRALWHAYRIWRRPDEPWRTMTAIHPDFARRVHLADRLRSANYDPALGDLFSSPREHRLAVVHPGASILGGMSAELGASARLEVRDPTADSRVMSFVFSVPDEQWRGPLNRWLLRRAMRGVLPDAVRLNTRRGRQAADVVPRLRRHVGELQSILERFDRSPVVGDYVNLSRMRQVERQMMRRDDPLTSALAKTVLLGGIGAGLFLEQL